MTAMAWGQFDRGLSFVGLGASAGVYGVAAINTVKLLLLRGVIVVLALPGYVLAIVAGLFEGLVARDIRKFTGGHESAYVFHKAKRWIAPSVMVTVTLYLMLPWSVPPALLFAPTMLLAAGMVYIAASRFKKFV
jgi:integrating conjugative element membrane protein (TIGR03747 family)